MVKTNTRPEWLTPEVEKARTRKKRAWAAHKIYNNERTRRIHREEVKAVSQAINRGVWGVEMEIAKQAKSNPKKVWSYVKGKTVNRSSVGPIVRDKMLLYDDREQAEELNKFFASVFTIETDSGPDLGDTVQGIDQPLETVVFTE